MTDSTDRLDRPTDDRPTTFIEECREEPETMEEEEDALLGATEEEEERSETLEALLYEGQR